LYVAGLQGWQTEAARITGLDRVRYTGRPVYMARDLKVDKAGVHITFTQPLDPKEAVDPQNYSGKRWNYRRTANYGSDEYSVATPERKGRDTLDITAAKVSPDGKTVTLAIDDLRPANVQIIRFNLKAKDGTPVNSEIQHTIHAIP
ncbi:MAG: heme-binding protein, partial [Verrucomicrobia bacterium]